MCVALCIAQLWNITPWRVTKAVMASRLVTRNLNLDLSLLLAHTFLMLTHSSTTDSHSPRMARHCTPARPMTSMRGRTTRAAARCTTSLRRACS
jgi:hypothetical protein